MSNPNENQSPKQVSDYIGINENGELVVTDPKLAESLQELSTEELEQIAGGVLPTNGTCTNNGCGKAVLESDESASLP
ncbi:type A2 lanthipeptide [Nostoc punctiforme]|uniref:Uncharacterized protein n=1 Tax=Nostoc punctiforme (strain ATCC 29133 / PCC 73102) TaxID=63737 RepID=B2JB93_NOSP7|nr:type A2 lanthipeptide [Nostoc punctiforme]ACC85197.1 hypothetical protein Npun_BF051 [Nostoc punctiforme PCC 73102]